MRFVRFEGVGGGPVFVDPRCAAGFGDEGSGVTVIGAGGVRFNVRETVEEVAAALTKPSRKRGWIVVHVAVASGEYERRIVRFREITPFTDPWPDGARKPGATVTLPRGGWIHVRETVEEILAQLREG